MTAEISETIATAIAGLASKHAAHVAAAEVTLLAHPSEAVPALIEELVNGRAAVQAAALLGRLGSDVAVTPLVDAARRGGEGLRWHAVIALGQLGGDAALEALFALANSDEPDIRRAVAWALGARHEQSARAKLDGLTGDPDPAVRDAADRAMRGAVARDSDA